MVEEMEIKMRNLLQEVRPDPFLHALRFFSFPLAVNGSRAVVRRASQHILFLQLLTHPFYMPMPTHTCYLLQLLLLRSDHDHDLCLTCPTTCNCN